MLSSNTNWKSLINHRVLVEPNPDREEHNPGPREFKVLEVSPSGELVKFTRIPGRPFWVPIDEYLFIEDLGEDRS